MLRPFRLVLTEVAAERLLAPGALARVGDGRKRGHGLVFAGVLEELCARADGRSAMRYDAMQWAVIHAQKEREGKGRERKGRSAHQSQSAMPAHAVAEYTNALWIHLLEVVEDGLGQFRRDVAVHFVTLVPGRFRRVDVEASTASKVIGVVLALDV